MAEYEYLLGVDCISTASVCWYFLVHSLPFAGVCIQNDKLLIVTQFCDRGSLGGLLKAHAKPEGHRAANSPLPLDVAITLARQVAEAMSFIHSTGVVHRDLKPDNILLESGGDQPSGRTYGNCRVCDLGLARVQEGLYQSMTAGVGTAIYMPPEAIQMDTHLGSVLQAK